MIGLFAMLLTLCAICLLTLTTIAVCVMLRLRGVNLWRLQFDVKAWLSKIKREERTRTPVGL